MDIENELQEKNLNVANVQAPLIDKYPNGYVDTPRLPLSLTWVISTTIDPTATISKNVVQVDVLVQHVAQGITRFVKNECKNLRDLFITEYSISTTNMWVSNDPPIRIVPGTVEFGGFRDVIMAPDETPFHGFSFTMQVEAHLDASC